MSAELELRWLKINKTKGAAKRFAEFCREDIREQIKSDDFDLSKYQDAVKLVMRKLDNTHSISKIFDPEESSEQATNKGASK